MWEIPCQDWKILLSEYCLQSSCRSFVWGQQLWALPPPPEEAIKRGFIKASNFENMYHRHKNQTDNVKYYNKKTGQEIIFDANAQAYIHGGNVWYIFKYLPKLVNE